MKQANGNQYLGEFDTNGLFTGYSILNFNNGNSYHGDFFNGIMQGAGVMKYKNGDKFTGEFRQGRLHEGLMDFAEENESYVGQW